MLQHPPSNSMAFLSQLLKLHTLYVTMTIFHLSTLSYAVQIYACCIFQFQGLYFPFKTFATPGWVWILSGATQCLKQSNSILR